MRAWLLDDFKGLGCLRAGEVDKPRPAPDEVLLRVQFAALNPADRFLAESLYPAKPHLPHILGRDGSGSIDAIGERVRSVGVGDRVCVVRGDAGVTRPGTLAEYVAIPEEAVVTIPAGWTAEEAAAGPLVYLTAYQALTQWGPLENANVLITGVSGGVGLAALHLARTLGHRVIGTTRGDAKVLRLKEHGADHLIDPGDRDFRKKIKEFTEGKGVDLVVDNVAGELFNVLLDTLAFGGRISVVGMLGGVVPNFQTAKLLFRRTRIGGVLVADYQGQQARQAWAEIVRRLDAAGRRPVIDSVFPFDQLLAAFDKLAEGPFGKVLVRTSS